MALRTRFRWVKSLFRWLDRRPWLVMLFIFVVVMTVSSYRQEQIIGTQGQTLQAVRDTQETGSPTLVAITRAIDALAAQQDDIEAAANASVATNNFILDCTQPEGECAKESAAREAAQKGADLAANVASFYCHFQVLPEIYTYEELFACVGERLDGEGDHR